MMNLVANPHRGQEITWSCGAETLNGELTGVTVTEDRSRVSRSRLVLSSVGTSAYGNGGRRGVNLETSELPEERG